MKHLTALLIASFFAGLLGCDTVTLDGPIGESLAEIEATAFIGRWTNTESEVVEFRLTNAGKLTAGTLSWDNEQQKHIAQNYEIDARRIGNVTYFLFADDEHAFGFVRVKQTGDLEFKMYSPDAKTFRAAVEGGKLDGKITAKRNDHFDVLVRADSMRTKPIFSDEELGDWYDDELTQTFHCIKRFDSTSEAEQTDAVEP